MAPLVDVNLLFHNAEATLDEAIGSVVTQSWSCWRLTLLDDGSTDGGPRIAAAWAARDPRIRLKRHRANQGIVGAYRRAFAEGDADFVMPKSADDLLAPRFMEALMGVLLADPEVALCHAGAVNIDDAGAVTGEVPEFSRLDTPGGGPLHRALHVMRGYTLSPAFWGIYRRSALDLALPPQPCGGWDHAFLAEIALYGHIRHVPDALFMRRGGPAPLTRLARNASLAWSRARSEADIFADPGALAPTATCLRAHLDVFAVARLPAEDRAALIEAARDVFRDRWPERLRGEAAMLAARWPALEAMLERARAGGAGGAALRLGLDLSALREVLLWACPPGADAHALSMAAREAVPA